MIKKIYIAGPLFNKHEQTYLEEIAKELEGNGYDCFLPHRDQTGIDESELEGTDMSQETKDRIFRNDLNALEDSDLTVALLTCLLYTSPSPRDRTRSRMPSSA